MSTQDKIVLEWGPSLEEMIEAGHLEPTHPAVPILQKWLDQSQEIVDELAFEYAETHTRSLTDELKWLTDAWRAYLGDSEVEMQVPVVGLSNVYLRV